MTWSLRLTRFLKDCRRLLVLGVGNMEKGDDAAGAACAEALARGLKKKKRPRLRIINAGQVPENYTGEIRRFAPTHIVIIDACRSRRKAGSVSVVTPRLIAGGDPSTHRMPLSMLIQYLEETTGGATLLIGIEPATMNLNAPLSPEVARAVERVAGRLAQAVAGRRTRG